MVVLMEVYFLITRQKYGTELLSRKSATYAKAPAAREIGHELVPYETSFFKTHPPDPLPFEEGKGEFFRRKLWVYSNFPFERRN